jgi:hypothetical protein
MYHMNHNELGQIARTMLVSLAGWAQVTTVVNRALILPMIPPRVDMCVLFALFPMCTGTLLSIPVRPTSRSQWRWRSESKPGGCLGL